jgi:hypothetical protein
MTRALDGLYQLTLMPGTRAGDAFWDDFSLFRNESEKTLFVFIIYIDFFLFAETACPPLDDFLILFSHECSL